MENIDKRKGGGLKQCPFHRFNANYNSIGDGWYKCEKCGAFTYISPNITQEERINYGIAVVKLAI